MQCRYTNEMVWSFLNSGGTEEFSFCHHPIVDMLIDDISYNVWITLILRVTLVIKIIFNSWDIYLWMLLRHIFIFTLIISSYVIFSSKICWYETIILLLLLK